MKLSDFKILVECIVNVHLFFNEIDKTASWFFIKNPNFGSITPISLIVTGRGKKVLSFILTTLNEEKDM